MTKRTIKRTQPAAEHGHSTSPEHDTSISASMGEDSELLLLALLEQLHSDRAAGLYRDLTTYCAANPELSDAFLELAAASEWEEYEDITGFTGALGSRPLSPGVRKALASIAEFSEFLRAVVRYNTGEWLRTSPATVPDLVGGRTRKADKVYRIRRYTCRGQICLSC